MERLFLHAAPKQFLWGNTPAFCLVPKGDDEPVPGAAAGSSAAAAGEPTARAQGASGSAGSTTGGAAADTATTASGTRSLLSLPEAHICFAASGDLRNVIATVNGLAEDHPVRCWGCMHVQGGACGRGPARCRPAWQARLGAAAHRGPHAVASYCLPLLRHGSPAMLPSRARWLCT